jgi:hypothetical protein
MKRFLLGNILSLVALPALAQTPADCSSDDGQYLTGVVTKKPYWVKASETVDGVQLSHTHITLRSAANSKLYDVAIDNVFNPTWAKLNKNSSEFEGDQARQHFVALRPALHQRRSRDSLGA